MGLDISWLPGATFTSGELADAFADFRGDRGARRGDPGRDEVRAWIWKTRTSFPGSHMTARSSGRPTSRSPPQPATGGGPGRRTSTTGRPGRSPWEA